MQDPPAITRLPAKATIIILGLFAAASAALLAWLTLGEGAAIAVALVVIASAGAAAWIAGPAGGRVTVVVLSLLLVGTLAVTGFGLAQLFVALAGTNSGPAAPPDSAALEAADSKIATTEEQSAFRLVLTEPELNALLQDALASVSTPFHTVTVDILNAAGEPGRIGFAGAFKNGSLDVDGTLSAVVVEGGLELKIIEAAAGIFSMPAVARDAVEDMISTVADLERALAAEGADVQDIVIGDERVVVTGINRSESVIDAVAVLAGLEGQIDPTSLATVEAPGLPPGRVARSADGDTYYLALGDSLGAAVGVDDPHLGYVSRFHSWLEMDRNTTLGLRNLSMSGETSGGLLWGGQLDEALGFIAANNVAVITINIGANDLLGHLAATDCSGDTAGAACNERINAAMATYGRNINHILDSLREAAPAADIYLLTSYNPFSLGFEDSVRFEQLSNDAVARLNRIAADTAADYAIVVADGFGPMRGTTTVTTHMVDAVPDIHPTAVGYDILTGALVAVG